MPDTQITELAGRHYLISQLLAEGIEVAMPVRDRGVDLIAYVEQDASEPFFACPVQLKANEHARFVLDEKYHRISNLLLVYAWHVSSDKPELYALTYDEAYGLLSEGGHTETKAWRTSKTYTLTVGPSWREILRPFYMSQGMWRPKMLALRSPPPATLP